MTYIKFLVYKLCHPPTKRVLSYKQARKVIQNELSREYIYTHPLSNEKTNTEHIFPQSFFKNHDDKRKLKSDLHHLYPCIMTINSKRGNYKFEEIDSDFSSDDEFEVDHKNRLFEPDEISKGNTARACAYIYCAYNDTRILEIISPKTIVEWNKLDPVSDLERARNDIILQIQGNRNPFIDYPHLVEQVFNNFDFDYK